MSRQYQYDVHRALALFPLIGEDEFQRLKQDIAEHGQREDIVLWCGRLIDGRARLRACQELGRQIDVAELDCDQDLLSYIASYNLCRRHLTASQQSSVAGKLAELLAVEKLAA